MDFGAYTTHILHLAKEVRQQAAQEYDTVPGDSLSGIKMIAELTGIDVHKVLGVLLTKHFISITRGVTIRDTMDGRIIDAINYLLKLGYAMREEQAVEKNN